MRDAVPPALVCVAAEQPFPLLFATLSGAHLYGFPSADSDFDVCGVHVLPLRDVPVSVEEHREQLLAIRQGALPWPEINAWRLSLHREFDAAYAATKLPERPDYERANALLLLARRTMVLP